MTEASLADLARAYARGAPGVLLSGIVLLIAAASILPRGGARN